MPKQEIPKTKHCNGCGRDLPRSDFYANTKGGLISRCKECCAIYQAKYRAQQKKRKKISWFVTY